MKTLFLRHDLRTKNIGWIRKVNDPMKMAKINGNTDTTDVHRQCSNVRRGERRYDLENRA